MSSDTELTNIVTLLLASNSEIREGIKEQREDVKNQREEIKDLIESVNKLAKIQIESTTEHRHSRKEISEIKLDIENFKDDMAPKIRALQISQSSSNLKWKLLAAVFSAVLTLTIALTSLVVKPMIDNSAASEEVKETMNGILRIMVTNYRGLEAAKKAEETHRARNDSAQ